MNQFTALFFFFFICTIVRFVTFFVRWWFIIWKFELLLYLIYNNDIFVNKKKSYSNCCPASDIQVNLFEIHCAIFYTNLHEFFFCQFISWTNWVNSGKFMDKCWISCQVMADMKKVYNYLIIINLYCSRNYLS